MKWIENVEVTSRRGRKDAEKADVVATIRIPQYDTLSEAVSELGSEERVLSLVNTQHATNLKNAARSGATATLSDRKAREAATAAIYADDALLLELAGIPKEGGQRMARFNQLVEQKMAEAKAAFSASKPATVGAGEAEDGDDN